MLCGTSGCSESGGPRIRNHELFDSRFQSEEWEKTLAERGVVAQQTPRQTRHEIQALDSCSFWHEVCVEARYKTLAYRAYRLLYCSGCLEIKYPLIQDHGVEKLEEQLYLGIVLRSSGHQSAKWVCLLAYESKTKAEEDMSAFSFLALFQVDMFASRSSVGYKSFQDPKIQYRASCLISSRLNRQGKIRGSLLDYGDV